MSDNSFFREVDEAVRHDQYKALWDKFGVYVIALAAVLIASVAGYKGWSYWKERQAQSAGAEFVQAMALKTGIPIDTVVCYDCGHVELVVDKEQAKSLVGTS